MEMLFVCWHRGCPPPPLIPWQIIGTAHDNEFRCYAAHRSWLIHSVALMLEEMSEGTKGKSSWLGVKVNINNRNSKLPAFDCHWPFNMTQKHGDSHISPVKAQTSLNSSVWLVLSMPCVGWSGDLSYFLSHLPANAFTLSGPIIIQPVMLRAAIP